ncbi:unnamed protein product [Paramecium sonneborni]|uniref:Uncharacterized protein n=1 Tax=Paramecium sonneborni TaxID=65129 RepID=A0A8S1RRP1_9CILI|nr:unnamed protein product [Paramecium sonneborni]
MIGQNKKQLFTMIYHHLQNTLWSGLFKQTLILNKQKCLRECLISKKKSIILWGQIIMQVGRYTRRLQLNLLLITLKIFIKAVMFNSKQNIKKIAFCLFLIFLEIKDNLIQQFDQKKDHTYSFSVAKDK